MPITLTTSPSGRRTYVSVPEEPQSVAALGDLLAALRCTGTDELVVDLSQLHSIGVRLAAVLARVKRHHDDVGRRLVIICQAGVDLDALRSVGLDQAETISIAPARASAGRRTTRRRPLVGVRG